MTKPHNPEQELAEKVLGVLDTLANARSAREGSLVGSRPFSVEQLAIETDFRAQPCSPGWAVPVSTN